MIYTIPHLNVIIYEPFVCISKSQRHGFQFQINAIDNKL